MTPGKKSGLGDAEEETQEVETELCIRGVEPDRNRTPVHVRNEQERRRNQAPGDHDARDPDTRADALQQDITGHFENEVTDEEHSGAEAVDRIGELQIGRHLQLGETDVDAVQKRHDVTNEQKRNQTPGNLAVGRYFEFPGKSGSQLISPPCCSCPALYLMFDPAGLATDCYRFRQHSPSGVRAV